MRRWLHAYFKRQFFFFFGNYSIQKASLTHNIFSFVFTVSIQKSKTQAIKPIVVEKTNNPILFRLANIVENKQIIVEGVKLFKKNA